jgi:hypothetical protein
MARVVIRVDLHGEATERDYERLNSQMATAGFVRTITSSDGIQYWLPDATYASESYGNEISARDAAWNAANGIVRSYAIVATCGPSAWQGLSTIRRSA